MRYYIKPATEESMSEVKDEVKQILFSPLGLACILLSAFIGSFESNLLSIIFISFLIGMISSAKYQLINPFSCFQPSSFGSGKAYLLSILFSSSLLLSIGNETTTQKDILDASYSHDSIKEKDRRLDFINNSINYTDEEKAFHIQREELKEQEATKKEFFDFNLISIFLLTTINGFFMSLIFLMGYYMHLLIFSLYMFRKKSIRESLVFSKLFKMSEQYITTEIKKKIFYRFCGASFLLSFLVLASSYVLLPLFFVFFFCVALCGTCFYNHHIYQVDAEKIDIIDA